MSQMPRFLDQIVIVTGASSGFGLATARAFSGQGATVVLAARNPQRLQEATAQLQTITGAKILGIPCDVSDGKEVQNLAAKTIETFGRIDILINNAGSGLIAPFEQVHLADAIALFETNFFGALNCTQAVLPHMKQQRSGQIVNMASVAGLRGIPNSSMYCASKAALIAFSDALRIELRQYGISVTTICPSRTDDTPFVARAKKYGPVELYKVPEKLTTEMVVEALIDATVKRSRMVILPFHAWLMNAVNTFAPRAVDNFLYKRMPKLSPAKSPPAV